MTIAATVKSLSFALALGGLSLTAGCSAAQGLEAPRLLPAPATDAPAKAGLQTAVLSGGCFWGVQGVFQHVKGVTKAVSGYAGGRASTASYELVGTGTTGHAESVQITFDPKQISYGQILRIFFSVATDPTQVGGQFPDRGPQYRTEIFYADADQKRVAQAYIAQLTKARAFPRPIATRVDPLTGFYPAEAYHQDYLTLHPTQGYIATYDIPKVQALKALFPTHYRTNPVLVATAR
ncbi:MAG TPA: peptide-methionine (S)-S-oxide reductase MsrA [Caulobacteraceae bacterium]|jgi:peptide-methionine (S)-S-oxide reductase|nr:peptide-methionine (S)-S-oxide reductase MsrA [Caulobacteraceae bacterium]